MDHIIKKSSKNVSENGTIVTKGVILYIIEKQLLLYKTHGSNPACMGQSLEGLDKGGEAEGEEEDEWGDAPHHVCPVPTKRVLQAGVLAQLVNIKIKLFWSIL